MSTTRKVRVELSKIDTREEVDVLEHNLKQLSGVEVLALGLVIQNNGENHDIGIL